MPNGGTDNCMNCGLNRANQRSAQIKGLNPHNRITFCTVRDLVIQSGHAWTYCEYSHGHYWRDPEDKNNFLSEEKLAQLDSSEPVYTVGVSNEGYSRIPYFKGIAPVPLTAPGKCELCEAEFKKGVWITSFATDNSFNFGFCCNDHYKTWQENITNVTKPVGKQAELFEAIEKKDIEKAAQTISEILSLALTGHFEDGQVRVHPLSFENEQSWSPIHLAILKFDDNEELSKLITGMCSYHPLIHNHFVWSPIHLAAYLGKTGALSTLLEIVATNKEIHEDAIYKKDLFGKTPAEIAGSEGHTEALDLLFEKTYQTEKQKNEALLKACEKGNLFLTEELVKRGADVNTKGHRDWTPLMNAAYHAGDRTIVTFLLDKGADKSQKNKSGKDVLDELRPWSSNTNTSMIELIEKYVTHP